MPPRRHSLYRFLLLAAVLLSSRVAQGQVHELPTRFYLLPTTQHRYDSAHQRRVTLRCWLLRYTERYYRDAGNGKNLMAKDRASWFFGRVTRQVRYLEGKQKIRVYRYRRNFPADQGRPVWAAGKEFIVAAREFRADNGKIKKIKKFRAQYYKVKQWRGDGKMAWSRQSYQKAH